LVYRKESIVGHYVRGEYKIDKKGLGGWEKLEMKYQDWDVAITLEKIHPDAIIPKPATPGSAGFDLHSIEDVTIYPGETKVIKTGLKVSLPGGHLMYISSRGGLAAKHNIFVLNSPGLVDSDYRGEIMCIMHKTFDKSYKPYLISKGDRVAQFVVMPHPKVNVVEATVVNDTERGEGRFSSTGK
jgi:dUTP pyrophosphatase